ncbi:MAG: DUF554 domain-containing protein [Lachnospiraceae bacterium]|nr:DUF554 domain-containing protein [Lachnospiraceae bacterium]
MPIGIIINSLSIVFGGIIGTLIGHKLSLDFKEKLNMIFGSCSMAMGISSIALMESMPAVIFSIVIGTAIGLAIHFGDLIAKMGGQMQRIINIFVKAKESNIFDEEFNSTLLTIIVLFCASGTGIYDSIVAGISGDHSILIAKSILDLFTALIFACLLGAVVSFIAIPQFLIFLILFYCGNLIFPFTTPAMINDFKATGGILLLATGFRMIKVKMFPTADMIPAMILAMPVSYIWTSWIMPLL